MKDDHMGTDPAHPRPQELSLSNWTWFSLKGEEFLMPQLALPTIAFAMGDPAGISPELAAKLLNMDEIRLAARLVVFGDERILREGAKVAGVPLDVTVVLAGGGRRRWARHFPARRSEQSSS